MSSCSIHNISGTIGSRDKTLIPICRVLTGLYYHNWVWPSHRPSLSYAKLYPSHAGASATKVFTPLGSVALFYIKTSKKHKARIKTDTMGPWDAGDVNLDDICPMGAEEGGRHMDATAWEWL